MAPITSEDSATFVAQMPHRRDTPVQSSDVGDATEPIVATSEWQDAVATVTVIDLDEFEAAHDDPEWRAFCERADVYVESLQRELLAR